VTLALRVAMAALGTLVVLLFGSSPALAATINVDTTADDNNGTVAGCSLREAVIAANTNANFGQCIGSGAFGTDTINVPASGSNYQLTLAGVDDNGTGGGGDIDITTAMNIVGAGANSVIVQQTIVDRVFHIPSSSIAVSISGRR
jgi:CSLREA domain-containing protein